MIFPATIYCTQGKLLVKSIIPQEYSVIREKTAITLLLREKEPFAFVCRKKRRKHLNLGCGNCFVIGLTLLSMLFSTSSSSFEKRSWHTRYVHV